MLHVEIAVEYGVKRSTVTTTLSRLTDKLMKLLENEEMPASVGLTHAEFMREHLILGPVRDLFTVEDLEWLLPHLMRTKIRRKSRRSPAPASSK